MGFGSEPGTRPEPPDGVGERLLDPSRRLEVLDRAAADAHQMMVMTGEVFGHLEPSELVGAQHPAHDTGLLEHRQVAVGRALRQLAPRGHQLRGGHRAARLHERFHEHAPAGGVALIHASQPRGGHGVQVFAHGEQHTGRPTRL